MRFPYTRSVNIAEVEELRGARWREETGALLDAGCRLLALFALPGESPDDARKSLCSLLCHDEDGSLHILRSEPLSGYASLTPQYPQAHLFERELCERSGVMPAGHPWLKPVRFNAPWPAAAAERRPGPTENDFFRVEGAEIHEVAVGPVHAGIIEPGHFRFQCLGETVLHLEICLGFQHRGAENLFLRAAPRRRMSLVECLAGDTSIGHATAYCTALERLAGIVVPPRARLLRRVALELERLANHIGDLGAIGGDTGFLPTSAWNGRIRGDVLNTTAVLCGNRFGRNLLCPGGVRQDLSADECADALARLQAAYRAARASVDVMLFCPSVHDRLEGTGPVSPETARSLGLVGMAARACGLPVDARFTQPLGPEPQEAAAPVVERSGDVLARTLVRSRELDVSTAQATADLKALAAESPSPVQAELPDALPPLHLAVAQVEGWRGEICHLLMTDATGRPAFFKAIDPSFHNWQGLAMALRGQQISDFPLCNKSFNLSYCGFDL